MQDDHVIPPVTAEFRSDDDEGQLTEGQIRGMICNPIYAGIGPFPQLIDDEQWVAAATKAIQEDGPEQFLVNMLYVLRETFGAGVVDIRADQ